MEESVIIHLLVVNCLDLGLIEPFDTFAIFPKTKLDFAVLGDEIGAETVLLALVPETFIATLISPGVDTKAMLLVILVLTTVHSAVVPDVNSHAFHVVVEPFALVLAAV